MIGFAAHEMKFVFKKLDGLEKAKLPIASCLMGEICQSSEKKSSSCKEQTSTYKQGGRLLW